jgi:dihydroorotate dehydrogenase
LTDSEWIHRVSLRSLSLAAGSGVGRSILSATGTVGPGTSTEVMGLHFRNRVGLGAGFDKDGQATLGWAGLGLGFVELGTVTPRPQAGQPRPRLWRLPADEALVNRMGFNNHGAAALAGRLARIRPALPRGFVVGVNIGRNASTPDSEAEQDYREAVESVAGVADYLVINVSSPNTPGLADMQDPARLLQLVDTVQTAAPATPVLVKLSPDLADSEFAAVLDALRSSSVQGLVLSNTTRGRIGLRSALPNGAEVGGLSGAPLRRQLVGRIALARAVATDRFALIASGGIGSALDASRALSAGADLVQLWTGLVYRGPGLIGEVDRAARRWSTVEDRW